jgi:CheY-like chemotaxis protein
MDALRMDTEVEMPDTAKEPLRVLVIDDDESVCAAIHAILTRRNSRTKLAERAHAGIEALQSSTFDVVLIDLFMPGLSGLDTIAHIRRGSAIPIIAMSGFRLRNSVNSVDYLGMAMQRGASACLRKPFTPEQLIEAIDRSFISTAANRELI